MEIWGVVLELINGALGLVALALAVVIYRRQIGGMATGWRWLVLGIAFFALSELHVLVDVVPGAAAFEAYADVAYRLLQAAFIVCTLAGIAVQLRTQAKLSGGR
jgi:hypothetical protein